MVPKLGRKPTRKSISHSGDHDNGSDAEGW
jgi:hypothetical protein